MSAATGSLERAETLALSCYTDPAVYAREVETIFRRGWLSFARDELLRREAERFTLRVHVCEPEGVSDEQAEPLRAFVDAVHREDIAACSSVQRGSRTRLATRGRLSHLEKCNWQFHRWLAQRMGVTR